MKNINDNSDFLNEKNLETLKYYKRFHLFESISGIVLVIMLIIFFLAMILSPLFWPGTIIQNIVSIIVGVILFIFLIFVIKIVIFEFYLFGNAKKDILNPNIIDISGKPYKVKFKRDFGGRGSTHSMILETYIWFNIDGKKIVAVSMKVIKYKKGCFNKKNRIDQIKKRNYNLKIFQYSGIIVRGYKKY